MSDNTPINAPTVVGQSVSTEVLPDGSNCARGKIILGAHGVDGGDVTTSNPLPVTVSDGTHTQPAADVAARALFAKVTDGTNTQPTGDVIARSISVQLNDGTNVVGTVTHPVVVAPLLSGTATSSNVASSATNVELLAANAARKGATIYNDSTQVLYVKLGTTASTSSYAVQLAAAGNLGSYYEIPFGYTGEIDGVWASANGNARIVELT